MMAYPIETTLVNALTAHASENDETKLESKNDSVNALKQKLGKRTR
jgi:hypothetical protein